MPILFNRTQEDLRKIFGFDDSITFKWVHPDRVPESGFALRIKDIKSKRIKDAFHKIREDDDFVIDDKWLILYAFTDSEIKEFNSKQNIFNKFIENLYDKETSRLFQESRLFKNIYSNFSYENFVNENKKEDETIEDFLKRYEQETIHQRTPINLDSYDNMILDTDPIGKFADIYLNEEEKELCESLEVSKGAFFIERYKFLKRFSEKFKDKVERSCFY
jgi:hypothetical protein